MKSSKETIKNLKKEYGDGILVGFLDTLLELPNAEFLGLYDLAVLCANFNIIRNELFKKQKGNPIYQKMLESFSPEDLTEHNLDDSANKAVDIKAIIEESLNILNSGADYINNEKFLKDCFEYFRVRFNNLNECLN